MLSSRIFSLLILTTALAVSSTSCDTIECGNGTIEIDGQCTVPDAVTGPGSCGVGTRFEDGECVSATECGPNTTPDVLSDGTIICVGGEVTNGTGCDGVIPACRAPSDPATEVTVCGVLRDIETNVRIQETVGDDEVPALCDQANPTANGPCSIQVRAFDPLQFAANPDGTAPLAVGEIVQDECGRFAILDVPFPFNQFVAVATTNVFEPGQDEGDTVADTYRQTGTSFGVSPGDLRDDIVGAVTRRETDVAWTTTAGCPFNEPGPDEDPCLPAEEIITFADQGVYVPVYGIRSTGEPVEGVKITAVGTVRAELDYYFSDPVATSRATVDPAQDATGANGTGLLTPTSLRAHSGEGAEPNGCEWSSNLAASIPNVVFFQNNFAHVLDDPMDFSCPQP